ncbi:erythrocyte binding protein [Planoprotostelium fungivorum]|uniref:Erythrocyte binding protein n=1 Tax=Planoprotostelium fungivorum TaxID=1890364 RepID=A0A2P6NT25_9EUKA|nr:erythrocyte binding protein [Planoprotostelium fungivorum]
MKKLYVILLLLALSYVRNVILFFCTSKRTTAAELSLDEINGGENHIESSHSEIDQEEKWKNCPYFRAGHCPFDPAHPEPINWSEIRSLCPAFKDGCPYKDMDVSKVKNCPAFADGKCPFDDASTKQIDFSKIKDCPAFKNHKCPYTHHHQKTAADAADQTHDATVDAAEKSVKCPFFGKGCPFDPSNPHAFDATKAKDCPAFKDGCPYKDMDVSKLKKCPAFADGKCPFDGTKDIDYSKIKDCPAFKDHKCPYAHHHGNEKEGDQTHDATVDAAEKSVKCPFFGKGCPFDPSNPHSFDAAKAKDCPAFKDGCPYKDMDVSKLKKCPAFADGKCPFDGSKDIDYSKIKDCPAFKDHKCPYAHHHQHGEKKEGDQTHDATVDAAEKSVKCPFFGKGCPFDPSNPHSFDATKAKDCPAFKDGCPYKDMDVSKLKKCPAFADGKCPFDGTKDIDYSKIKDCPAFKDHKCPYAHHHQHGNEKKEGDQTHEATADAAEKSVKCPFFGKGCPFDPSNPHSFDAAKAKDCPAFKDGCPYKDMDVSKLKKCPAFADGKCPFDGSKDIDYSKMKDCPAFKDGCPYAKDTAQVSKEGEAHTDTEKRGEEEKKEEKKEEEQVPRCPFHHLHYASGKKPVGHH